MKFDKLIQEIKTMNWRKRGKWFPTVMFSELLEGEGTKYNRKLELPFEKKKSIWLPDGTFLDSITSWDQIVKNQYKSDPKIILQYGERCLGDGKKLLAFADQMSKLQFFRLDGKELADRYCKFMEEMKKYMPYMDSLHIYDEFLTDKFGDLLNDYIKRENLSQQDFFDYQICLTLPKSKIFVLEERDEFAKLVINKNASEKEIKNHAQKYSWINTTMFENEPYTIDDFRKKLNTFRKNLSSFEEEWKLRAKEEERLKRRQKIYMKKIRNYQEFHTVSELVQLFGFLRSFRIDVLHMALGRDWALVKEICGRLNFGFREFRTLDSKEIGRALTEKKFNYRKILKERQNGFISVLIDEDRCEITDKDLINKISNTVVKEDKLSNEVKGSIAYPGSVQGVVRIVHGSQDMSKVNKGDILVCSMTDPNLIPAMEKASAFVTDMGGILCHAAIVSREMKKPCIIGTKIATQVLKGGDLVEVDANKGVVKILKKAK